MRRGSFPWRILTFGGRVPPAVGGLIVATALASLGGVVAERSGAHVLAELALVPSALLGGELWRLVTWPLVETDPLSLLFAGLTLYWFGRDLCLAWGPRRFLLTFFGVAAAAGLVTTLLGVLAFGGLLGAVYAGSWAVLSALVIAWATLFPERQILLMFALPMSGRALLWVTVGITLLYAVFGGFGAGKAATTSALRNGTSGVRIITTWLRAVAAGT